MTIRVAPTNKRNTHHVRLYDGSNEVGLILCNYKGGADKRAIELNPNPTSALKTYTGEATYSDEEPPFKSIAQEDFSGGRGKLVFDEDARRYYDGLRVDTLKTGKVFLGPREEHGIGYRNQIIRMVGKEDATDFLWKSLNGTTHYRAVDFTVPAGGGFAADKYENWFRKVGSPTGSITVELCADSGGEPGTVHKTATVAISTLDEYISEFLEFDWTGTYTLVAATKYWIKIYHTGGDASNYIQVACEEVTGLVSDDDITWSSSSFAPYYRVTDADDPFAGMFFEYKRGLYMVRQQDDGGNSLLYLNGDRGSADDNTGNLDQLIDATKSWDTDEWAGCRVMVTKGPGSNEPQPWRNVQSNTGTVLTVSEDWTVVHTTQTEYVILGADSWQQLQDLGDIVTDVAVADEYVYFARGDYGSNYVLRYQAYNTDVGTWTERTDAETKKAKHLVAIQHPTLGQFIYGSLDDNAFIGTYIWRGQVPRKWGDLYTTLGELAPTTSPWDEQNPTPNVTVGTEFSSAKFEIDAAFGTTVAGSIALDPAVDMTEAKALGFYIKSSVDTSSGDLQIQWDDAADLGSGNKNSGDIPALSADEWTWVRISISPKNTDAALNERAIVSVGLNVAVDNGAQDVWLFGGIQLLREYVEYWDIPNEANVTGLIAYAGGATTRVKPWIFTENSIYYEDDEGGFVPLALGEIAALRSETNGQGRAVNDVYLWFSMGERIQRYYQNQMDNLGADLDEGLPSDRQGNPITLLSYPGRILAAYDGVSSTQYSSIMVYENSGWHELYRSHRAGMRIRGMHQQSIPNLVDRLWFVQDGDIMFIPISLNPLQESGIYHYTHEGILESGRYYGGRRDISKYWDALKLATEQLSSSAQKINVDYRTDENTTWTAISSDFDTSPFQEEDLSSSNDVTGRWIQFRYRLFSNFVNTSPILISAILEGLIRVSTKDIYTITFRLADDDKDLNGNIDTVGADEKLAILNTFVSNITPITMDSISTLEHGKVVFPEPVPVKKIKKVVLEERETFICQMNLIAI